MSQTVKSQIIEKTCDGCGAVQEYEIVGMQPDSPEMEKLQGWYTVIREVFDPQEGRFVKLLVQACTLACVPAAAVKMALPQQEHVTDRIDLSTLKVN